MDMLQYASTGYMFLLILLVVLIVVIVILFSLSPRSFKKKMLWAVGFVFGLFIFIHFYPYIKSKDYYLKKYNNSKNDYHYFSSLKDSIFRHNRGCHIYSASTTIRDVFSMSCNSYNVDSATYFKDNFLDTAAQIRMKKLMRRSNLETVIYYPDSVDYIFADGSSVDIIYYPGGHIHGYRIDSNYYLRIPGK